MEMVGDASTPGPLTPREAAGHGGGCPCARERRVAEPTVRVVPPAIGGAARLEGAGLVPPCAQRCETAPAGDGEWCRAAGDARVAALLLAGRAGAELREIIQAPAVRETGRREAAAVHRSDVDGGQAQIRGHRRRREAVCLCGIATLAVRAVAPAVRHPACREAAGVIGARLNRRERHNLDADRRRAALGLGGRRDRGRSRSQAGHHARRIDGRDRRRVAVPVDGGADAPAPARVDHHGAELRHSACDHRAR